MAGQVLGFVGVGKMGSLMALRLLGAGHSVMVFDSNDANAAALASAGATVAKSVLDIANTAEIVFASLPTPAVVRSVALGEAGIAKGSAVKVLIDLSTTGPRVAAEVAEGLRASGIAMLDCPVSGGLAGARDGRLAIMVSGPQPTHALTQDLIDLFGKVFFVGETPGSAQTLKLANNLLAACAIAISSEAFVMGVKAGLDPQVMCDVINVSSGRNSATQDKFPRSVLPGTFDFGFATGLSYKDVRLCLEEAEALGVPMPVGSAVRQMLAITNSLYGAESDFTSMIRPLEQWAGVEVRSR